MSKKTKIFIEKARKVHGNKFDYSKVEYVSARTKVDIICDNGHTFQQIPNSHLSGRGCRECYGRYSPTTEEWIKKAKEVHGNLYDYSKVEYIGSKDKVKIICRIHGKFKQRPSHHLRGSGCIKCSHIYSPTTEEWIESAKEVHGDRYNYSKVKYTRSEDKVIITCPIHGDFEQIPSSHLSGSRCQKCVLEDMGWTNEAWTRQSENSQHFDSFKVYIIRCWNEEEEFIKIGKTFTTIERRFWGKKSMPYNYEIIKIIEKKTAEDATDKETELHYKFRDNKYIPEIDFGGMFECFTKNILKTIKI